MAQGSRRRGRVFIYLALIIILAFVLVYALFRNQFGVATSPEATPTFSPLDTVTIVVTTQSIPRGTELTESVLTTIPYPKRDMVEGTFFTNVADVVGKRAKFDLDARVPVTTSMVVDTTGGSFAAFQIPKGMVAVSIPIKDRVSFVSYAPQAGDHVNVIATMLFIDLDNNFQTRLPNYSAQVTAPGPTSQGGPPALTVKIDGGDQKSAVGRAELETTLNQPIYAQPSENQRPRMVAQTLLQDAVVLHVGNFTTTESAQPSGPSAVATPTPTPAAGQGPTQQEIQQQQLENPDIITLIVTPQDAVTLNYLILNGAQITLALRGAGDDQRVQTEAVTLQYLMDQYNIPVPAKLPYGTEPRVDLLSMPSLPNDVRGITPK
jgi:Flp pilus assembly protein CpaB